jgi:hypothetical protein
MNIRASRLGRIFAIAVFSVTSLGLMAPAAQAATVLEGPGHVLSSPLLFDAGSAVVKTSIQSRLEGMLVQVPSKPWQVHITVNTSEAFRSGRGHNVALLRVDAVVNYLKSRLEAAGATVFVNTTIWYQPGFLPNYKKNLRYVYADLNW